MPSYISELFNTDPYYDDFNESKKFLRVMFRPGYGVQARELTQLQTILQNQVERFGNHVFEEGSIVTGGKITINSLKYARLSGLSGTTDVKDFIGTTARVTDRSQARIIHAEYGLTSSSIDNLPVIFFDYLEGGTGFTFGDRISATAANTTEINASVTGSWNSSGPYPVGDAYVISVDEGIRYAEGFFVFHEPQKIGAYSLTGSAGNQIRWFTNPTTRVGFSVDKVFITSDTDSTLNDPAFGSYNYNAPGADRFQIDLNIGQGGFTATNTSAVDNFSRTDFIEFLRLVDGSPIKIEKYPEYAVLEDSLARRTYDESGSYTVRPFEANLVDGVGITNSGSTGSIFVDLEPGKAYVFGYEFETQSNVRVELEAARTQSHEKSVSEINFNRTVGPYCQVEFSNIPHSLTAFAGFDEQPLVQLSSGASGSSLSKIGSARVRGIEWDSGNIYNLHLCSVEMTGPSSFDYVTRIFTLTSGTTHAFAITGSSGLQNTKNGDLLFNVPSGNRVKSVDDANYAIMGFFEYTPTVFTSSGSVVSSTFQLNVQDYTSVGTNVSFSLPTDVITTINQDDDLSALSSLGSVGGTAVKLSPGTSLSVTVSGRGVTANSKIYITTGIDVSDISDPLRRKKTPVTETSMSANAGGFTGVFSGLSADQYGNYVLYFGGKVDVYEVLSLTGTYNGVANTQIKNYFEFDSGQRDNLYDWSRMVLKAGIVPSSSTGITGPYHATIRRFNHTGIGPFTVDSYTHVNGVNYSDIPDYTSKTTGKTYNLADVIDFRPDRGPTFGITGTAWIPTNTDANDNQFSYTHYLPRTDKIVLKRDRSFSVIQGVPSLDAITPPDDPNAMTLYTVTLNPFTYDKDDASLRYIDNRRYTMRDIGELEKRVEAVEYYTTLSLLEQEAKTLSIVDDSGIEIPKKGILVDQFKGHNIGDVTNQMYAASIDFDKNELRPPFEHRIFGFSGPDASSTNTLSISDDGIITLPYTVEYEINQILATNTEFVNRSGVINYSGKLKLTPQGDYWFNVAKAPVVRVNVDGENNAWASGQGLGFSGGCFGSQWNDWESIWYGREVQSESNTRLNLPVQNSIIARNKGVNLGNTYKSGIPEGIKRKTSSKLVKKDVLPYSRKQNITLEASGLKPNTKFYIFLDNIDITPYCTGSSQFTDSRGECTVEYRGATGDNVNNFLTGKRNFRITDSSTNNISQATMAADAFYNNIGFIDSLNEDGVLSTRSSTVRRRSVKSNKVQSNLSELLSTDFFGFTEPLSQTFFVDPVKYPNGIFARTVKIAFATKSTSNNIPVTLQIRPTISGYPHPSKIIPFAETTLYSDSITTSSDGSAYTEFVFSSPVYLLPSDEYAICLVTNSSEFTVYKSIVGNNIIKTSSEDPDRKATKQPNIRSMFLPQNTGSMKKTETESLKFSIGNCHFSPQSGNATYKNSPSSYSGSTYFDAARINVNHILPSSTNIKFEESGLLSNVSYVPVQVNKNIDRPAISSSVREKSASQFSNLKMTLYGNQYVSPVVDTESSHFLIIKNKINNSSNLGLNLELSPTNLGVTSDDNKAEARYITKQVILEEGLEATDIHVQMALCNPYDSSIQVFVRPMPIGESDFTNIGYQQLTPSDATSIGYSSNSESFREITFSKENLPKFRAFSIKIVMYSSSAITNGKDPRNIPKIKNLRIIAV